jgi:hypothetical protein
VLKRGFGLVPCPLRHQDLIAKKKKSSLSD